VSTPSRVRRVVLASASPRRRELLAAAGVPFEVRPTSTPEDLVEFADPTQAALELARRKARAGLAALGAQASECCVIGADTIVAVLDGAVWRLLGKPEDERDAERMLAALSHSRHQVITGVCVLRGVDGLEWAAAERTWVTMRPIAVEERRAYVASGEWRDKAGGYAIQESADRFVTRLEEGGFDNVVGLPVALTLKLLAEAGAWPVPDGAPSA
jgi:septum formation protein